MHQQNVRGPIRLKVYAAVRKNCAKPREYAADRKDRAKPRNDRDDSTFNKPSVWGTTIYKVENIGLDAGESTNDATSCARSDAAEVKLTTTESRTIAQPN